MCLCAAPHLATIRPDSRRALVGTGLGSALLTVISGGRNAKAADGGRQGEFKRTEEEWRKALTPEQFYVLRGEGTERPFSRCGCVGACVGRAPRSPSVRASSARGTCSSMPTNAFPPFNACLCR